MMRLGMKSWMLQETNYPAPWVPASWGSNIAHLSGKSSGSSEVKEICKSKAASFCFCFVLSVTSTLWNETQTISFFCRFKGIKFGGDICRIVYNHGRCMQKLWCLRFVSQTRTWNYSNRSVCLQHRAAYRITQWRTFFCPNCVEANSNLLIISLMLRKWITKIIVLRSSLRISETESYPFVSLFIIYFAVFLGPKTGLCSLAQKSINWLVKYTLTICDVSLLRTEFIKLFQMWSSVFRAHLSMLWSHFTSWLA
jgi:hypothetical protein